MSSARPCWRSIRRGSGPWPAPPPRTCATCLPHINVPTLLVYGDKDVRAPLTIAENLHAALPGSTLVVLPDTGHLCNIENPKTV